MTLHIEHYKPTDSRNRIAKPLLFLIHGGALSHRMYKDVIPFLNARGYEVFAPDLPGHGQSASSGPFTFNSSTKLLNEAVKSTKQQKMYSKSKVVFIGISLGGQAILHLLSHEPECANTAIVSGVSIHPPNDGASWEMPHMPTSKEWLDLIMEGVNVTGLENAQRIQTESFGFNLKPPSQMPPVLVLIGERDVAMAKRDFQELVQKVTAVNDKSRGSILGDAWHNHSIDIPDRFAETIDDWVKCIMPDS